MAPSAGESREQLQLPEDDGKMADGTMGNPTVGCRQNISWDIQIPTMHCTMQRNTVVCFLIQASWPFRLGLWPLDDQSHCGIWNITKNLIILFHDQHLLNASLKPQVKVRQTLALLIFPIIITLYLCFLMKFAGYFNRQVKDTPRKDFLRPEQLLEGKVSHFFCVWLRVCEQINNLSG